MENFSNFKNPITFRFLLSGLFIALILICNRRLHKLFSSNKRQQEPTRRTGQQNEMYDEFEETNYQNRRMNKVSRVFLMFENKKWEWKFLNEPDLMLKYSVLMSCVVLITIFGIQVLNRS